MYFRALALQHYRSDAFSGQCGSTNVPSDRLRAYDYCATGNSVPPTMTGQLNMPACKLQAWDFAPDITWLCWRTLHHLGWNSTWLPVWLPCP